MKFKSGLANCHLPGLYSMVLSERESPEVGMKRVFYAGADCEMSLWDGADFRLKPHNHRQSIKLTKLFGEVSNVALKSSKWGGIHVWKYKFGSVIIDGDLSLERMEDDWCELRDTDISATPLAMHWSDVHTVVASQGSAWLVEELELAPDDMARCFSVSHRLSLSNQGLYTPMDDRMVEVVSKEINGRL